LRAIGADVAGSGKNRAWLRIFPALTVLTLTACGPHIEYYGDGLRRADGDIADATSAAERETGPWTWWYPNGEPREQGTLDNGRRIGTWTQWYPNGQLRSRGERAFDAAARASPRTGAWTFWHENGEIHATGIFVGGRREGHWDYTLDDGSLDGDRTGEYHDDRRID
jgi:hypothetical protein